jgi:hypothetical protein
MPLVGCIAWFVTAAPAMYALWQLRSFLHPGVRFDFSGTASGLIFFSVALGAIVPALMLANILLASITPLRRILDAKARGVPEAGYRDGMTALSKAALFISLPALILGLIGAIEPWAL